MSTNYVANALCLLEELKLIHSVVDKHMNNFDDFQTVKGSVKTEGNLILLIEEVLHEKCEEESNHH